MEITDTEFNSKRMKMKIYALHFTSEEIQKLLVGSAVTTNPTANQFVYRMTRDWLAWEAMHNEFKKEIADAKKLLHSEEQTWTSIVDSVRVTMSAFSQLQERNKQLESKLQTQDELIAELNARITELELPGNSYSQVMKLRHENFSLRTELRQTRKITSDKVAEAVEKSVKSSVNSTVATDYAYTLLMDILQTIDANIVAKADTQAIMSQIIQNFRNQNTLIDNLRNINDHATETIVKLENDRDESGLKHLNQLEEYRKYESKAKAWDKVWESCKELGMDDDGKTQSILCVLDFIQSLKTSAKRGYST